MVRAVDIWKSYSVNKDRPGFKEFVVNVPKLFGAKKDVFWALRGVSLEVRKGECLGVIGKARNNPKTLLAALDRRYHLGLEAGLHELILVIQCILQVAKIAQL